MVVNTVKGFLESNLATPGYTVEETILYGFLLVAAVYVIYNHFIKKSRVKVDKHFFMALIPYIIMGAFLRNIADTLTTDLRILFFTPMVYVLAFAITLVSLVVWTRVRDEWHKPFSYTGYALSALILLYLSQFINNYVGIGITLGVFLFWVVVLCVVHRKWEEYLTRENLYILLGHMLDGSATFVALQFHTGLVEEHVIPSLFIGVLGPAAIFLLKLGVVWPVLYYVDKDVDDEEFRVWMKIIILILGLALGLRNILTIGILGIPA